MRNIEINLADVKTFDDFHNEVSSKLGFPEYYGRNLDAMHDCLTDIADEVEVVFTGVKECRAVSPEMSAYIDGLERMLNDTADECDNLTFIMLAENDENTGVVRNADADAEERIVCEGTPGAIAATIHELGIGEGDCVFASVMSSPEVVEGIRSSGAVFVPVDISPEDYGMDPRMLDLAIGDIVKAGELDPCAIIVSKAFGIPQKMDVINVIAEENGLDVIYEGEDEPSDDDDYLRRIGDAYRLAFQLRFGKGSTRLWLTKLGKDVKPVWKSFPVRFTDAEKSGDICRALLEKGIDANIPNLGLNESELSLSPIGKKAIETTISLPVKANMVAKDIVEVVDGIWEYFGKPEPEEDQNPFSDLAAAHPEHSIR